MISSAVFGLVAWAMLAFSGWWFLGPVAGLAFWRVVFVAGYSGFIMGLVTHGARTDNEKGATACSSPN